MHAADYGWFLKDPNGWTFKVTTVLIFFKFYQVSKCWSVEDRKVFFFTFLFPILFWLVNWWCDLLNKSRMKRECLRMDGQNSMCLSLHSTASLKQTCLFYSGERGTKMQEVYTFCYSTWSHVRTVCGMLFYKVSHIALHHMFTVSSHSSVVTVSSRSVTLVYIRNFFMFGEI